jgi:RNA polymerase sigma-70 factor (ECF subfamily)
LEKAYLDCIQVGFFCRKKENCIGCRSPPPLFWFLTQKNQNGGSYMKKINLRDLYPFYNSDFFIEVADEVAELIKQLDRKEHADYERIRVNKAYYSLDAGDGIERDIVLLILSPEEIYERKLSKQELYAAINSLPEKQAKRIYAHFFLGMSKAEIARIEGVNKCQVSRSIDKALKNIEKFLKKFL